MAVVSVCRKGLQLAVSRRPRANVVGQDIRVLRRARKLTLKEVAFQLGRSAGWLSQVERSLSDPSIADLRKMAELFGIPLGFFFVGNSPLEERDWVVRRGSRRRLGATTDGLMEELLSPDLNGRFLVFLSVFEPGATLAEPASRPTEDAGYLVSGTLELWIGKKAFRLAAGDSFRFSGEPYRWRNPGADKAIVVWVIAPPSY